jgi:hypothetical protein
MSERAIDSETNSKAPEDTPKRTHKGAKKAKAANKAAGGKKASSKPDADRSNKKAEVISLPMLSLRLGSKSARV